MSPSPVNWPITATYTVPSLPSSIIISFCTTPDGKKLFITYLNRSSGSITVDELDPVSLSVNATINLASSGVIGGGPTVASLDNEYVYVLYINSSSDVFIAKIQISSQTLVTTFSLGNNSATYFVLSPDGLKIYTFGYYVFGTLYFTTLFTVNTSTGFISYLSLGDNTFAPSQNFALTPNGERLCVSGYHVSGHYNLYVINAISNSIVSSLEVTGLSYTISGGVVSSTDSSVFYVCGNTSNVYVVNANSGSITNTITVGNTPTSLALLPDNTILYAFDFAWAVVAIPTSTLIPSSPVSLILDSGIGANTVIVSADSSYFIACFFTRYGSQINGYEATNLNNWSNVSYGSFYINMAINPAKQAGIYYLYIDGFEGTYDTYGPQLLYAIPLNSSSLFSIVMIV